MQLHATPWDNRGYYIPPHFACKGKKDFVIWVAVLSFVSFGLVGGFLNVERETFIP